METGKAYVFKSFEENNTFLNLGEIPRIKSEIKAPKCKCGKDMLLLAQVGLNRPIDFLENSIAYIFMCEGTYDDNGLLLCETWEFNGEANRVIIKLIEPIAENISASYIERQEPMVNTADFTIEEDLLEEVSEETKIGGVPYWLQDNETPLCSKCNKIMTFILQINSESIQDDKLHFGGSGIGYMFLCTTCQKSGFLWQCD